MAVNEEFIRRQRQRAQQARAQAEAMRGQGPAAPTQGGRPQPEAPRRTIRDRIMRRNRPQARPRGPGPAATASAEEIGLRGGGGAPPGQGQAAGPQASGSAARRGLLSRVGGLARTGGTLGLALHSSDLNAGEDAELAAARQQVAQQGGQPLRMTPQGAVPARQGMLREPPRDTSALEVPNRNALDPFAVTGVQPTRPIPFGDRFRQVSRDFLSQFEGHGPFRSVVGGRHGLVSQGAEQAQGAGVPEAQAAETGQPAAQAGGAEGGGNLSVIPGPNAEQFAQMVRNIQSLRDPERPRSTGPSQVDRVNQRRDLREAQSRADQRAREIERDSFNATGGRGVTRAARSEAEQIRHRPAQDFADQRRLDQVDRNTALAAQNAEIAAGRLGSQSDRQSLRDQLDIIREERAARKEKREERREEREIQGDLQKQIDDVAQRVNTRNDARGRKIVDEQGVVQSKALLQELAQRHPEMSPAQMQRRLLAINDVQRNIRDDFGIVDWLLGRRNDMNVAPRDPDQALQGVSVQPGWLWGQNLVTPGGARTSLNNLGPEALAELRELGIL